MSSRSPWLKAAAAVAALGVLGAVAATVALKTLFPEPKLRAMVVDAARRQLGREVRLQSIGLGLSGLRLSGLEVSERPDFESGTFLRVETFRLRPSWRAALRRRLVVAAVSADGLKLRVVKSAAGAYNFETLASSAPAAAPEAPATMPGESLAADFRVRHVRVAHGELVYVDEGTKESWSASELALSGENLGLAEPFELDLSLRLRGKAGERPVNAAISFAGTVHPARGEPKAVKAEIRRFSVEQDGAKLSLSGRVARLDAPEADFKAALSVAGKTLLEVDGKAKLGPAVEPRSLDADLKARTPGLDTTLLARLLPAAQIPAVSIPAATAELKVRRVGPEAEVSRLLVAWEGGKIEGKVSAKGLGSAKPLFDGAGSFGLDIPEIRPGQWPFLKLPPKAFVPAMRLDGELSFLGDEIRLKSAKAKLQQGTIDLSGVVRQAGTAAPVPDLGARFELALPAITVGDLPVTLSTAIPASFPIPALSLKGGARVRGAALTLESVSIQGKGVSVRLAGSATGLQVQAELELPALTDKDFPPQFAAPAGLEFPASKWETDLSFTPQSLRLKKLGVKIGSNEAALEGAVSDPLGRRSFDLILKCRHYDLPELTRLTPLTRDLKLQGSGFFSFAVTGTKEAPRYNGKLLFKNLGATVADLALSEFEGAVSVDETSVKAPKIKGKVADGTLGVSVIVEDYGRENPKFQVIGSLDRFDLASYLSARAKLTASAAASRAAAGGPAEAKPAGQFRTTGDFEVGLLTYTKSKLEKTKVSWDLFRVTPDLKRLAGEASIRVERGRLRDLADIAKQIAAAKVLLATTLVIQKLRGADFNDITVHEIAGDYAFKDGRMTVNQSRLSADNVQASARGDIDLPSEALDLIMTVKVGNLPQGDVKVTGTLSQPKSEVLLGTFLKDGAKNILNSLRPR